VPIIDSSVPAPHLERRVRSRDNDTSWAAAAGINAAEYTSLKLAILRILTDRGPLTDEAIFVEYVKRGYPRRTAQRVRTARHEITEPRFGQVAVRESDEPKVRLDSGYHGQKWERI
jgi:hypothetical protein